MVWGLIFETCGWKALFGVFKLREFIYHVGGWGGTLHGARFDGDTSFPTQLGAPLTGLGGGQSVCRGIKNKRETPGTLSIPAAIASHLLLFPESAAVLCFASPCVLLAFKI